MKKRLFAFTLILALVFSVAGCNNGKTESEYTVFESALTGTDADTENNSDSAESDQTSGGTNQGTQTQKPGTQTQKPGTQTQGNQTQAPNKKPTQAQTSATGTDGKQIKLANPVFIAEGTKPMDQGLDFGGKTFTIAVREEASYSKNPAFTRLMAAFEKKYNCKLDKKVLDFGTYPTLIGNADAAGKPYDIFFCHGSMFPSLPLSGAAKDLSGYLTTADYDTGKGGIDIGASSYFAMDNKLYGLAAGDYALSPIVIFYNKTLFEKNDLEDPYELYKSGKWTWSKFREQGKKVSDATKKIYYADLSFKDWGTIMSFGTSIITWENNKVVNNLTSTDIVRGYQLVSDLFTKSKVCNPDQTTYVEYEQFIAGQVFTTMKEITKYENLCGKVANSQAFSRNHKNVGIVPVPQDSASAKKGYPSSWYDSVMSGGSETVAVAFAKFMSTYNDPVKDKYELSDEMVTLRDKLISGNIATMHGSYVGSDGIDTNRQIQSGINLDVALGKDPSSSISAHLPKINAAIEFVLKK